MSAEGRAPEAGAPDIDRLLMSRTNCELLARCLFDEKERLLQEGQDWGDLTESDKSYWLSMVRALLYDVRNKHRLGAFDSREVTRDDQRDPSSGGW